MLHGYPPFCERLSLPLQLLARSLVMRVKKNHLTTREMLLCLSNTRHLKKSLAASRPLRLARPLCPARNSRLGALAQPHPRPTIWTVYALSRRCFRRSLVLCWCLLSLPPNRRASSILSSSYCLVSWLSVLISSLLTEEMLLPAQQASQRIERACEADFLSLCSSLRNPWELQVLLKKSSRPSIISRCIEGST